jgi:sec-independent protein translocase protein TatC
MIASPVIIYQFWMFVAPGLYDREKRLMIPIVFLSSFFFVGGALFGYFIVFPFGFDFFSGLCHGNHPPHALHEGVPELFRQAAAGLRPGVRAAPGNHLSGASGHRFRSFLKKNRKYALLLFFVGAAILTPPDVVTQIMMALPLMLLYEISIIGARIFGRKKEVPATAATDTSEK